MPYRFIFILALIAVISCGTIWAADLPSDQFLYHEISGNLTNNIRPKIEIKKGGINWDDWNIEIDYLTQTNFAKYTWLKPSQRIGSKLQLWLTNGVAITSTNASVLAAMNLPSQTTVLNVMKGVHPSSRRGILWLQIEPGMSFTGTGFNLKSCFNISFTNDVVLQITPLLYKVETNQIAADLVEFPPLKLKLEASGNVQQIN